MSQFFLKIYSVLAWTAMGLTSVFITPFFLLVWVLTFWWDKRRLVAHMMGTFWAWHYQSLIIFWKLRLEGRKKIPWNRPVVLVANHRSLVDVLALYKVRRPVKWVSKAENFRLPFIGMVLSLSNCIRINRESLRSGLQFISQAEKEMKKGSSVMIFPEGTRSKTKEMRPFRDGAFILAKKIHSGIIPIVHTGTENAFSRGKNAWVLKGKTKINIRVLDEIPAEQVANMETEALKQYTREIMEQGIAELESENLRIN
ncbi:MAG: 1-acyl-sn-glycerol-3-phosphate acyltransferase [Bacteroidales bacterium]|nr:1-acyl-sn-glycerol-3-phosphate acyltransferase [Bacteroidales bacterium]MDT8431100.1 1-acyl-sn-glycerol-3-phosphate acyltransferase [Bacteroidales bacterium]